MKKNLNTADINFLMNWQPYDDIVATSLQDNICYIALRIVIWYGLMNFKDFIIKGITLKFFNIPNLILELNALYPLFYIVPLTH